jgi:hypothetical protein
MREGSGIAPDFQNEKVGEETIALLLPKGLAKKRKLERGNSCHTKMEFGNHYSQVKMFIAS